MSSEASQLEAAILRIERLVQLVDLQVVYLEERVRKQEEWLAQSWVAPSWNATAVGYVDGCNSLGLAGAKVTFKDHASGAVLTTTTTDANGKYVAAMRLTTSPQSVDIVATPPAAYATEFAASGTLNVSLSYGANTVGTAVVIGPATGYTCDVGVVPVLVCSSGRICVTVTDGCSPSAAVVGATITVKDTATPPNTIGTCTTDASGQCCVSIPKQTAYNVSCAVGGTTTQTQAVNGVCSVDTAVAFTVSTTGKVCFQFNTCNSSGNTAVSGATVSITGAGTASGTSDASGALCLTLGVGSYSAAITYPSGYSKTIPFTVSACTTTNVSLTTITAVCVNVRTSTPAGCTGTVTITRTDTGATVGTGTLTTSGSPPTGQVCVSITECSTLDYGSWGVGIAFTNWTVAPAGNTTALACYSSSVPFFNDASFEGAPC